MKGTRRSPAKAVLAVMALVTAAVASACSPGTAAPLTPTAPPATDGTTVNVVRLSGLDTTVELEVLELDPDSPGAQPVPILAVSDPQTIEWMIGVLDTDVPLGPRARCLVQVLLRFHLADGTTQEFGYACADGGPPFLRGEQGFWQGMDGAPPAEFEAWLQEQLPPTP